MILKPKPSAWVLLLVICAPIIGLGAALLLDDPQSWPAGIALLAMGGIIVAYNATVRLVLTDKEIWLRRYGRIVWRVPLHGTQLIDGRGGEPALLPAYVVAHDGRPVGYILKGWFDEQTVMLVRATLKG